MNQIENLICVRKGNESLLFVLPVEVANEMQIQSNDMLKFEIHNGQLVIEKLNDISVKYENSSIGGFND